MRPFLAVVFVTLAGAGGLACQMTHPATSRPAFLPETIRPAYPLWDGNESVAKYAKRAGIKDVQIELRVYTKPVGVNMPLDEHNVASLIAQLGDGKPPVREEATRKLAEMGKRAIPLLKKKLQEGNIDPEIANRIEILLDRKVPNHDVRMRLTLIPAGTFMMGSPSTEPNRYTDEGPQHDVTISKPFYMGMFEVTQEQYEQVMDVHPDYSEGPGYPLDEASWTNAQAFCKTLSAMAGKKVTLPTEAQWEYACRAGTTTPFHTGDTLKPGQANACYFPVKPGILYETTEGVRRILTLQFGSIHTTPVGSFRPNGFGLYDMHGNVWEWCSDWYDDKYYARSPRVDPQGPETGKDHVLRGGGWRDSPGGCRSASREGYESYSARQYVIGRGFRVVVGVE